MQIYAFNPNLYNQQFSVQNKKANRPNFKGASSVQNIIRGQGDCWKLYKPDVFENFVQSDSELRGLMSEIFELCHKYRLTPSIGRILDLAKIEEYKDRISDFINIIKSKYDIDIMTPPLVHRFVGEEEANLLKTQGRATPQRYSDKFDVTINPELNWGDSKYRITFKPLQKFSILDKNSQVKENIGTEHDYFYYYFAPYTTEDVQEIKQLY